MERGAKENSRQGSKCPSRLCGLRRYHVSADGRRLRSERGTEGLLPQRRRRGTAPQSRMAAARGADGERRQRAGPARRARSSRCGLTGTERVVFCFFFQSPFGQFSEEQEQGRGTQTGHGGGVTRAHLPHRHITARLGMRHDNAARPLPCRWPDYSTARTLPAHRHSTRDMRPAALVARAHTHAPRPHPRYGRLTRRPVLGAKS